MNSKYKILIIAPGWVGDVIMSQALFKILRKQHQDKLQLDVMAPKWAHSILERMEEVNHVIASPFKSGSLSLWLRIKLGLNLRKAHYNQAIILPNSFKSALVPFIALIKKRTGFKGESRYILINDIYKLDKNKLPLMVERFCALALRGEKPKEVDYPILSVNKDNQARLVTKFKINLERQLIIFCPGAAYGKSKQWLPENFSQLADMLSIEAYQVLILGSSGDKSVGSAICNKASVAQIIDTCGMTDLADTVDLLNLSSVVVSNDSGLMHVACASAAKVIALYGSSSPDFTPPLSKTSDTIKVTLECSPCFKRTCRFNHYNCLKLITVPMVYEKLLKYLS